MTVDLVNRATSLFEVRDELWHLATSASSQGEVGTGKPSFDMHADTGVGVFLSDDLSGGVAGDELLDSADRHVLRLHALSGGRI